MKFKHILLISIGIMLISMGFCMANSQANLVLDGKSFTINDLTDKEISNIKGNDTGTIDIYNENGKLVYKITKATESTSILNDLLPEDKITKVESDGITYQNIEFSDGTPSTTVFKTNDGSIYEITYYNGNDFILDYKSIGSDLNH